MKKKTYGLWKSPLSPSAMAGQLRFRDVTFAGEAIVWCEGRGGKGALVAKRDEHAPRDLTTDQSARGGVGYGGGEIAAHGDQVYFAERSGRLFRVGLDHGTPRPITPAFGKLASPTPSPDGKWIAFVHTYEGADVIGLVDADGRHWPTRLVSGADFYMQPAWHPDGERLAWVEWDHPNMPWNGARLVIAPVAFGRAGATIGDAEELAGGDQVAVQQPCFSPDGSKLAYLSDEDGWWHVYIRDLATGEVRKLSTGESDHATPAWVQGLRHIAWVPEGDAVLAIRNEAGRMSLWAYTLDGEDGRVQGLEDYEAIAQLSVSAEGKIAVIGSSSSCPPRVLELPTRSDSARVVRRASAEHVTAEAYSAMQPVSWEARDGTEVFGNFYPPTSLTFEGSGGKPPALVMIHGGPTAQRTAAFEARNQFFATRGYAVLDVNYRGSTGYGRDYMDALLGQWGVLDVEDAVSAARFLAREGLADADKIVIMGGSAGGYTVLHALVKHPGTFAAGISMYGISNLFTLAAGTHKFEASYNDSLIGPLPEAADAYRERSPIFHVDQLTDPVAVFQGADDQVVPKDQADAIVASLRARNVPHVYHVYEGEGHGWRKAETIEHFYEATLEFLEQYVLFA